MPASPPRQPRLLSQMNERSVLRVLQSHGPCSRAEVTRRMGVTAPTVSKAVAALLRCGLLEEFDAAENGRGRPAKQLRLASQTAQVLGLVIDARQCRLVAAGLDGVVQQSSAQRFDTPRSYDDLLDEVQQRVTMLRLRDGVKTLGLGISMPGLIDYRRKQGLLSPNVPITDGHRPSVDLSVRLQLNTVLLQETHALCMAERMYGLARGLDDFAMLDATTGVGLGVFSGGRLLTGNNGLAGELGHVPVEPQGRRCGCGANGCLETVASDSALLHAVSQRLGKPLDMDRLLHDLQRGTLRASRELKRTCEHLAFALATVINVFNPATIFVHSRMLDADETLFSRLVEETGRRAIGPSFDACRLQRAHGSKQQGAIAGIIQYLTDSRVPAEQSLAGGAVQSSAPVVTKSTDASPPANGHPRTFSDHATLPL